MFKYGDLVTFRGYPCVVARVPSEGSPYYALDAAECWFLLDGNEMKGVQETPKAVLGADSLPADLPGY